MPTRKLPKEQIIELYKAGELTLREIGDRAGCTPHTIRMIVKRAGVPTRRSLTNRKKVSLDKALLERLYLEERLPVLEIAKRLGTTHLTLKREIEDHGIERRMPLKVKYSALRNLAIGESVDLPRNGRSGLSDFYLLPYYHAAKRAGIRVSVRPIDAETVRLTRVAPDANTRLPVPNISKEEIIELYARGEVPVKEIEKKSGISRRLIRRIALEGGAEERRNRNARARSRYLDKKILIHLYVKEGLSIHEVAKRLRAGSNTVSRELDRHGITKHKLTGRPPKFI